MELVTATDLRNNPKFASGDEHWHGLEIEPCHLVHVLGQHKDDRCVPLNCRKGKHGIPTPVELEQANCKHQATKRFSVSLDIDKCMQCNAYLVWCNQEHVPAVYRKPVKHWHRIAHADDAARMAKEIQ